MKTLLQIAQNVSKRIGIKVPDAVASSTQREHMELMAVINEAVEEIVSVGNWQELLAVATITGDGSTTAFALPDNYARMYEGAQLWTSSLETSLHHIKSKDDWLGMEVQDFTFLTNSWTIFGGDFNIKPALASGTTVKYFYMRNDPVLAADSSRKASFTADTDQFILDGLLLERCARWMWKADKGMSYQEEMASYEQRKESLLTHDKGARTIRVGSNRTRHGATVAYPKELG